MGSNMAKFIDKFKRGGEREDQSRYLVSLDIGTGFVKALIGEAVQQLDIPAGKLASR